MGIILVALFFLISYIFEPSCRAQTFICIQPKDLVFVPGFLLIVPLIRNFSIVENTFFRISVLLFSAIVYFFIGSFIGWLYGKIKNRNKIS